jgi:hypothetical protein
MAVALVTPLVAVQMYLREVPEEDRALDEAAAWAGAGALMGAWFSSFSLLLLLMKPEYRWGFVSLQVRKIEANTQNSALTLRVSHRRPGRTT